MITAGALLPSQHTGGKSRARLPVSLLRSDDPFASAVREKRNASAGSAAPKSRPYPLPSGQASPRDGIPQHGVRNQLLWCATDNFLLWGLLQQQVAPVS